MKIMNLKRKLDKKILYFKKVVKPSEKKKERHTNYLKTNLKKNFFN